jgi:hypothetical protein
MRGLLRHGFWAAAALGWGCVDPGTSALEADDTAAAQLVPSGPALRVVSEEDERAAASRRQAALAAELGGTGRLDALNLHTVRLQRVFTHLVGVAHRRELPWQVHWIDRDEVGAFTPGAGYLYVYEGMFGTGGLVSEGDDDELAAVLAHLIAHVALLHPSAEGSWRQVEAQARTDPYRSAAFSLAQEVDADRLAALYMALAGYDPRAAARAWVHAGQTSKRKAERFLNDHPLAPERTRSAVAATAVALSFYAPGEQRSNWQAILDRHPLPRPLFPEGTEAAHGAPPPDRAPEAVHPVPAAISVPAPGPVSASAPRAAAGARRASTPAAKSAPAAEPAAAAMPELETAPWKAVPPAPPAAPEAASVPPVPEGFAQALKSALNARERRDIPDGSEARGGAARLRRDRGAEQPPVRFLEVQNQAEDDGSASLRMHIENAGNRDVRALEIRVLYSDGSQGLDEDRSCSGPTEIAVGQAVWLRCPLRPVRGATNYAVEISDVQYR